MDFIFEHSTKINLNKNNMIGITLLRHKDGAPLFRTLGLGPNLMPVNAVKQLKKLLDRNSFWAIKRTKKELKKMMKKSSSIVTLWNENKLIGFGRATSDWIYRATLWDIVIDEKYQKFGLGKIVVTSLLKSKAVANVEKVYLMTTNKKEFYLNCGFEEVSNQDLLLKIK